MSYNQILVETNNHITTIIINRESKMNALNAEVLQEIGHAVALAEADIRVFGIIITGAGDKAFAAGADIAEFSDFQSAEGMRLSQDGHDVMNSIEDCTKPTVAAVKGFALGGGCELAMACHFRIAGQSAKFGQPEVNLGLLPGYGGTQRLVQLIGRTKALEYLCTGAMFGADDAMQLGLLNAVVEDMDVLPKSAELIQKISLKSPKAIERIIRCVNNIHVEGIDGYQSEIEAFSESFGTVEFIEGTTAFLEKRKPNFRT